MRAQRELCLTGAWGGEPVRSAYALAMLDYRVALDHTMAMRKWQRGHSSSSQRGSSQGDPTNARDRIPYLRILHDA